MNKETSIICSFYNKKGRKGERTWERGCVFPMFSDHTKTQSPRFYNLVPRAFPSHLQGKSPGNEVGVFKCLRFEERFRKAPFS